jgi:hypothetical protein
MKTQTLIGMFLALFLLPSICVAQTPHQVGGFVLGKNIAEYKKLVKMKTALPIRHIESIMEVEIDRVEGFKSGLISYGTCSVPGRIVRIKLKYADSTRKYYDMLLKRFKKSFDEPVEWRGDPFHVVTAWKWSFVDKENNLISLILQHNTKDEEEKMGNSVKLTMWDLIEDERRCFEEKYPDFRKTSKKGAHFKKGSGSMDWDRLIPR